MGTLSRNGTGVRIPRGKHVVYRGQYGNSPSSDPWIKCLGFSENQGGSGVTAQLTAPTWHWDNPDNRMKDAEIAVWCGHTPATVPTGHPWFLGYVNANSAVRDESTSTVSFTATSIAPRLQKVPVGTNIGKPTLEFRNKPRGYLEPIHSWTPASVMRTLFDADHLPSFWRAKVKLGDVSVLDDGWDADKAPDFIFTNTNLLDAIDQILSHCGDVYFTERFTSSFTTYLDFHRVSQPTGPVSPIIVCRRGEYAEEVGANAESIEPTANTDNVHTRVYAVGDKKRVMFTIGSDDANAPLLKLWDTSDTVVYTDTEDDATYTAEQLVLHDANLAKGERTPESYTNATNLQDVFRKYGLPPEVRQFIIAKDNAFRDLQENRIRIQVFKVPLDLQDVAEGENLATGVLVPGEYEEIRSVDLHLEEGYFLLGEPAINVKHIRQGEDGGIIHVYEEAVVGITLTLEMDPLIHDTGQPHAYGDLAYPWAQDGECLTAATDVFEYAQLTTADFPELPTYGCAFLHPDTGQWVIALSKQVIVDDSAKLRTYARSLLRENSKRDRSYQVTVPWSTRSFPLGSRVTVRGQANYVPDTYVVASAQYDLQSARTSLSIHSVRPPHEAVESL